jgi:ribonuclease J
MLEKVGELGASVGIPAEHCLIGENGRITELRADGVYLLNDIITDKYLLVDGTGVGAVSEAVLMERRQMATQGAVVVTLLINKQKQLITADVVSRGFVYMKTSRDLIDDIKNEVTTNFANINLDKGMSSFFAEMRSEIRTMVKNYIYRAIEKEPEVIPVIVQM